MRRGSAVLSVITGLALAATMAACGSASDAQDGEQSSGSAAQHATDPADGSAEPITVVASTNVYGSIAEAIGGDRVSVTSIIANPDQDPHSYEANTQNQLALSKAALVIENGGGYDDFVDSMLRTAGSDDVTVLNAVDISGHTPNDEGELNEHVWYDLTAMSALAGKVADALSAVDPAGADSYRANAAAFDSGLTDLEGKTAALKAAHDGAPVAITEPVPLYLLQAAGLDNKTPAEFSEAIEEDTDVPPLTMKETLDLFTEKQVAALVYNAQTSGPATEQVLKAAQAGGIPAVPVTETLPEGEDYLSWMADNIHAIAAALDKGASGQ